MKSLDTRLKPGVLRPDHNRMATTLQKPQEKRTKNHQVLYWYELPQVAKKVFFTVEVLVPKR